jgi:cytochrome d ubiquinol oxidase subunit II
MAPGRQVCAPLCLGYSLLGAGWLTYKTSGDVQDLAFRRLPHPLVAVLCVLLLAFVSALTLHLRMMSRWLEAPVLLVFPIIGLLACAAMSGAIRRRRALVPFLCGMAIFGAAFVTLAISFYPDTIPFSIKVADAASPASSLSFMLWGAGLFVLPITLAYTLVVYLVFKGKVDPEAQYH